jgi:hypothetical protein
MTGFESPNCIGNELGGFLKQFSDFATTKGVSTESGEDRNLMGVKRWLDHFVRMRHYRDRAAEFELLADAEPPSQVRLRYRIIAQHYKALADREERADQTRMAERLERLKLERRA